MARAEEDRYRQAAEETLDQLDWCVAYLRQIRKPKLAAQLERNCKHIAQMLRDPSRTGGDDA